MRRTTLTYATLAIVLLWLVFSYAADSIPAWPTVTTVGERGGPLYRWLLGGAFLAFLAIQLWLLRATVHMFRHTEDDREAPPQAFGLTRSSELFWTAIPLVMTLGLALISYQTWLNLTSP